MHLKSDNFSKPAGSDYLIAGFHWGFPIKCVKFIPQVQYSVYKDCEIKHSGTKPRCCYYDRFKKSSMKSFFLLYTVSNLCYHLYNLSLNYTFPLAFHSPCIRTVFSRGSCCHINPLCRAVGHVSSAFSISPLSSCLDLIPAVERLLGLWTACLSESRRREVPLFTKIMAEHWSGVVYTHIRTLTHTHTASQALHVAIMSPLSSLWHLPHLLFSSTSPCLLLLIHS